MMGLPSLKTGPARHKKSHRKLGSAVVSHKKLTNAVTMAFGGLGFVDSAISGAAPCWQRREVRRKQSRGLSWLGHCQEWCTPRLYAKDKTILPSGFW